MVRMTRGCRALLVVVLAAAMLAAGTDHAVATDGAPDGQPGASAAGLLPLPAWWHGKVCDTGLSPGSKPLGASLDGVMACGPMPSDGAGEALVRFPDGWGEKEWQCVELAMRWLYLAYGVKTYQANGNQVVSHYRTAYGGGLVKVTNGTVGEAPATGDVLSFAGTTSNPYGHTAVVIGSTVDASGNGAISLMEQNFHADGSATLPVKGWVVKTVATDGSRYPGAVSWLHHPLPLDLTLTTSSARLATGSTVTVTAHAAQGGRPLAGVSVQLMASTVDGTELFLPDVTTDASGDAAFSFPAELDTTFRAHAASSWANPDTYSPPASVSVHALVSIRVPAARPAAGDRIQIHGIATPARPGLVVQRQRLVHGSWVTLASAITDAKGRVVFEITPGRKHTLYTYRLRIQPSPGLGGAVSTVATVRTLK